ncbi:MAG: hydrogenase maturation nickel metallochaperone HypA [Candidatus Tectimicrobiota bacterium]
MHELAVARGILVEVLEVAQQAGAGRITAIELVSGDVSGTAEESLQFSFDMLSGGTPAEGAILRFRRAEDTITCGHCGEQTTAHFPLSPECPHCGSPRLQVQGEQELYVASIEVEETDPGLEGDFEFE